MASCSQMHLHGISMASYDVKLHEVARILWSPVCVDDTVATRWLYVLHFANLHALDDWTGVVPVWIKI
jgi:hypothetical protein